MSFSSEGYELFDNLLSAEELATIIADIAAKPVPSMTGGVRHADKKFASIQTLVNSAKLKTLATRYLDGNANLVRSILFDKTPDNNWLVSWHQDKTICVSQQMDIHGWGPWTIKDGVLHVQPPLEILESMIAIRIHIDDSTLESGCLKLIPGSHSNGILSSQQIQQVSEHQAHINCVARAGSALVMRPHLLHASSKAINPSHRRVIHIEYSNYSLPVGLTWA